MDDVHWPEDEVWNPSSSSAGGRDVPEALQG